jgi:hypothetical protein
LLSQSPDSFIHMDNTLDQEEYAKNIYVIRHKLAELKPSHGRYEYSVGRFTVHMYTYDMQDVPSEPANNILRYQTVNVVLNETTVSGITSSVSIRDDSRFKNYEPIQYNVIKTPTGCVNISNGDSMPMLHLCELIRYLHRLSNLTAFM